MTTNGTGTPESDWLPHLPPLTPLALDVPPERAVVVAPHPDDEVLGVGGLLALLAGTGTKLVVVAVTDGEASNPGGSVPPRELAARRRGETASALDRLGVRTGVRHLQLPDGGAAALEGPVLAALALRPGDWLLAPWSRDGHPDHDAVGRACESAAARDGARLLAYPVWAWHWAGPADLPWHRAQRVDLPPAVRSAKAAAVAQFVTQVAPLGSRPEDDPVLPPHVLAHFARPCEVVFT